MPNEESTARGAMTAAVFIFLAVLLVCPGMLLCVPSWSFRFFETGTIVLVTAGAALLFPQRVMAVCDHLPRGLLIAGGVLLGIGVWHGVRHTGQYNAAETGELFLTVAVPFAVCVFARELKRLLPWYLTLFWLIDVVLGFVQYYGLHWFLFGLPGNINWNAAFLAVTAPFAILTAWKWCPSEENWSVNSFWRIGTLLLVAGTTVWQIALTDSRGTLLGVAAAGALWIFLKLKHRGRRLTLFAVLSVALIGSVWFTFFAPHGRILENLSRDERVFLANTTMSMIAEQPEIGFGAPSFEQEYLAFRRPEYFSMRHSAVRVDHPHNHLLYIAAGFGILGLLNLDDGAALHGDAAVLVITEFHDHCIAVDVDHDAVETGSSQNSDSDCKSRQHGGLFFFLLPLRADHKEIERAKDDDHIDNRTETGKTG